MLQESPRKIEPSFLFSSVVFSLGAVHHNQPDYHLFRCDCDPLVMMIVSMMIVMIVSVMIVMIVMIVSSVVVNVNVLVQELFNMLMSVIMSTVIVSTVIMSTVIMSRVVAVSTTTSSRVIVSVELSDASVKPVNTKHHDEHTKDVGEGGLLLKGQRKAVRMENLGRM